MLYLIRINLVSICTLIGKLGAFMIKFNDKKANDEIFGFSINKIHLYGLLLSLPFPKRLNFSMAMHFFQKKFYGVVWRL